MRILGSLLVLSIVVISCSTVSAEPPPRTPEELMVLGDAVVVAVVKVVEPIEPDPITETQRESVSFRIEQVEKGDLGLNREFKLIFDSPVLATSDLPSNFHVDDRYRLYLAVQADGEPALFGSDGMERISRHQVSELLLENDEPPRPIRQARERSDISTDPTPTLRPSGTVDWQGGGDSNLLPKSMQVDSPDSDRHTENATEPKSPPHRDWMAHSKLPDPEQAPQTASPLKNWWNATVELLTYVWPTSKGQMILYVLILVSIGFCFGKLRSWFSPKVR